MTTVSVAEETNLWDQYTLHRTPELRDQIVMQSVPLVHYLLGRMGFSRENGMDYEDLVHQGLLGLIDAVDRFDPALGNRFSTYASIRIRGKIIDYLRSNDWMSRSSRRRVHTVQEGVADFWAQNQRAPSDQELAAKLNLDVDEVQLGLSDSSRVIVSLDMMSDSDGEDGESRYENQADDNQPDPQEISTESALKAHLVQALHLLPEREQQVLSLYYVEELTFKQIGKVLQISESRVCQLHSRAILNLKGQMTYE